jgi:hypothetical protein
MKTKLLLFLLIFTGVIAKAQVIEGTSTIYEFNMSTTVTETTPPSISISEPSLSNNRFETTASEIQIVGQVSDESGIFMVKVNGTEAFLNSKNQFKSTVKLAYNENTITILALDKNKNEANKSFIVNRSSNAQDIVIAEVVWKNPKQNDRTVGVKEFTLEACLNSKFQIEAIKVYKNDNFYASVSDQEISFRSGAACDKFLSQKVMLDEGINTLKVEVVTTDGVHTDECTVNYQIGHAKNYALVIAINKYPNSSNFNDLTKPVKDAKSLITVLTKYYTYEEEDILFLQDATRNEIYKALSDLRKKIKPEDNFMIFYAGHGYFDKEISVGYWLPSDANDEDYTWFSTTELIDKIRGIKAKHTLIIADACFSGGIFATRSINLNDAPLDVRTFYEKPSSQAITSGNLEVVPDESVFMKYFLKYLEENEEKYLSIEDLYRQIKKSVARNSGSSLSLPQFGTIQDAGDEGGEFYFIKK